MLCYFIKFKKPGIIAWLFEFIIVEKLYLYSHLAQSQSRMLFYRTIFCLILVFTACSSYGLQYPKQHPDSNFDIASLEKLVMRYRYDQPDSAIYFAERGLKLARLKNNEEGVAAMLNQLGMIDDNLGKADDSRQKYLEALEIYKRLGHKKGIVKENIRLGVVENRKGNYDQASAYFLQALKVSEKNRDKAGIMESYITLGEVSANRKLHDKAIEYLQKAEKISLELPFSNLKLNLYSDLGTSFSAKGDFEKAIFYFQKGISQSDTPQMMGLHISLFNGLADVYAKSGDVDKAIALHLAALEKSRKINNLIREFNSLMGLARSYAAKDAKKALVYLDQALQLAKIKNSNKQLLEVLSTIASLQARQANYKAAFDAKNQQYNIADSFYYKDIALKISDLQAQYELNKSEAKVQQLKFINSRQVLEQNIMLWIIGGSVSLLIVLSAYFFKIRNLNRLLNQSNTALSASNVVKDKLFSILAHDLRAPLNSVISLLDLINKGWLNEEEKTMMMNKLAVHCNASMETLDLLLQWGQMQLKGVMLNQVIINPAEIIERNISLFLEAALHKSILIEKSIGTDVSVFADADHLNFIIRNLLSNAIKFTPEGGTIKLSVQRKSDSAEVLFTIKDNGVGISEERLSSVFTTDSVSTNGTNNEKGTSLGLVICKEFVLANHGEIWVISKLGLGSEFFFTLQDK